MSREQRRALLEEFGQSGLSAAEFARHYGVKYQTFTGWLQRRKLEDPVAGGMPVVPLVEVPLVEVAVPTEPPRLGTLPPVVVELGGGARVELRASGQVGLVAELVAELVRALAAAGGGVC